jgi:hypothetical protein
MPLMTVTVAESLLERIRGDFSENPGLRLTPWQFRQEVARAE